MGGECLILKLASKWLSITSLTALLKTDILNLLREVFKMIRKIMAFIFVISVGFYSHVEAVMYANADPNYPFWTAGNKVGSALDLISAVEVPVREKCFQVCCLNYFMVFEKGDGEYYEYGKLVPDGFVYFREHNGELYYALSNVPTNTLEWKKTDWIGMIAEVFQLVKNQVKYK